MPAFCKLLLQQHGDLLVDFVAGAQQIVQRQVGSAGSGQHLLGLLRIIGALHVVGVVVEGALRNVGVGDVPWPKVTASTIAFLSIAMSSAWRTSFLASAPCSWLIRRWSSRVEGSISTLRLAILLQFLDAGEGNEDRRIELAGLHVQHAGVVVGYRYPFDAVELDPVGLPEDTGSSSG